MPARSRDRDTGHGDGRWRASALTLVAAERAGGGMPTSVPKRTNANEGRHSRVPKSDERYGVDVRHRGPCIGSFALHRCGRSVGHRSNCQRQTVLGHVGWSHTGPSDIRGETGVSHAAMRPVRGLAVAELGCFR